MVGKTYHKYYDECANDCISTSLCVYFVTAANTDNSNTGGECGAYRNYLPNGAIGSSTKKTYSLCSSFTISAPSTLTTSMLTFTQGTGP